MRPEQASNSVVSEAVPSKLSSLLTHWECVKEVLIKF